MHKDVVPQVVRYGSQDNPYAQRKHVRRELCASHQSVEYRLRVHLGRALTLVASDRLARRQILSHLQVMPQGWQGLVRPILQFRIVAAFGVAFKKRHGVFVAAQLIAVIA